MTEQNHTSSHHAETVKVPSRIAVAFGLARDPYGRPPFIWAERWNAPILMILIAVGTPLLGWSRLSENEKLWTLVGWLVVFLVYMLLEGREILGQMEGRGSISAPQARRQVRTAQLPHIGILLAIFAWAFAWAYYKDVPGGSPIAYGKVEWTLLAITFFAQMISNYVFNGMVLELSKSAPRGERSEMRIPRGS
ncbi:MAG: hypothetical protein ACYCZ0_04645 [Minisyncoccota bacterium]